MDNFFFTLRIALTNRNIPQGKLAKSVADAAIEKTEKVIHKLSTCYPHVINNFQFAETRDPAGEEPSKNRSYPQNIAYLLLLYI